jgi:hypothetical protein
MLLHVLISSRSVVYKFFAEINHYYLAWTRLKLESPVSCSFQHFLRYHYADCFFIVKSEEQAFRPLIRIYHLLDYITPNNYRPSSTSGIRSSQSCKTLCAFSVALTRYMTAASVRADHMCCFSSRRFKSVCVAANRLAVCSLEKGSQWLGCRLIGRHGACHLIIVVST